MLRKLGIRWTVAALLAAVVASSVPAHADTLFSDNFDADSASSVLNFNSFVNWNVINGSVDYIRNGGTCQRL